MKQKRYHCSADSAITLHERFITEVVCPRLNREHQSKLHKAANFSAQLWIQSKHKTLLLIQAMYRTVQGYLPPDVRSKGVISKPWKLFNWFCNLFILCLIVCVIIYFLFRPSTDFRLFKTLDWEVLPPVIVVVIAGAVVQVIYRKFKKNCPCGSG